MKNKFCIAIIIAVLTLSSCGQNTESTNSNGYNTEENISSVTTKSIQNDLTTQNTSQEDVNSTTITEFTTPAITDNDASTNSDITDSNIIISRLTAILNALKNQNEEEYTSLINVKDYSYVYGYNEFSAYFSEQSIKPQINDFEFFDFSSDKYSNYQGHIYFDLANDNQNIINCHALFSNYDNNLKILILSIDDINSEYYKMLLLKDANSNARLCFNAIANAEQELKNIPSNTSYEIDLSTVSPNEFSNDILGTFEKKIYDEFQKSDVPFNGSVYIEYYGGNESCNFIIQFKSNDYPEIIGQYPNAIRLKNIPEWRVIVN